MITSFKDGGSCWSAHRWLPTAAPGPPIVTLAIPNRNGGRYLRETLSSICSPANRSAVRWWFQDCCSDDDSVTIAKQFRSSHDEIRVEKDSGQTNGLNRAFAQMGGEIVGYLNSDDCLTEGAAQIVCEAFDRHPEAGIVFGGVDWIDKDGGVIGRHHGEIMCLEHILDIYTYWWNRKQWVQPEVFFRRSLYDAVGGFDETFNLAFDFDFWVRILRLRPVVISLPQTVVRFRRHDQQRSADFERANSEIRRAVVRELNDPSCPLDPVFRRRLANRVQYDLFHRKSELSPHRDLSFGRALMRSPEWLLLPEVRGRILSTVRNRLQVPTRPMG
jgi:glycosyltransferase involved in cell wall biosynthesis